MRNSGLTHDNTIKFFTKDSNEILKLCDNGDIFVKGKLIKNDKEIVDAMREFLISHEFLIQKN